MFSKSVKISMVESLVMGWEVRGEGAGLVGLFGRVHVSEAA